MAAGTGGDPEIYVVIIHSDYIAFGVVEVVHGGGLFGSNSVL
jgi:hypothetical protein